MKKRDFIDKIFDITFVFVMVVGMLGSLPVFVNRVEASAAVEIWDWYDLNAIRNDIDGDYVLMNDLDAATAGYEELASPTANGGKGWQPIGNLSYPFTGTFGGQGYEISDLFINRVADSGVGLFYEVCYGGVIKDVGVVDANVTGDDSVGGLLGLNEGIVSNSYSSGNVTGEGWYVGGLVGLNEGIVSNSYSTSSTSGSDHQVGGLVGGNGGTVDNSYSTGNVAGNWSVGGLVGANGGTVSNSYSTGNVTGNSSVGGLVGYNALEGSVSNSFWDTETSGQANSAGGTGKTTAEMKDITTFSGASWDIVAVSGLGECNPAYIWNIIDDETYPFLNWEQVLIIHYILTISSTAGGNVTTPGEGIFLYGNSTAVVLVAQPDEGYQFVNWTGDVDTIGNANATATSIIMEDDYDITANFEEITTYDLTISSTAGGNVTTPGGGVFTYYEGTVVDLVAEPEEDNRFVNWTGSVSSIDDVEDAETTITMHDDYSITANFRAISQCFIATAAYGTPMAGEIQVLREFRDKYLLTNPVGQTLVGLYYRVSPPMAEFITEHPRLKPIVRAGLLPAVAMSTVAVNPAMLNKAVMVGLLVLVSMVALVTWAMRRPRCRD
jgi:hypothetical protein